MCDVLVGEGRGMIFIGKGLCVVDVDSSCGLCLVVMGDEIGGR